MPDLITVEKNVSQEKLEEMNVFSWPVWTKEDSEFPWLYDQSEICYILEGSAEIVVKGQESGTKIEKGDLVVFGKGLECVWKITKPIKKRYSFN